MVQWVIVLAMRRMLEHEFKALYLRNTGRKLGKAIPVPIIPELKKEEKGERRLKFNTFLKNY